MRDYTPKNLASIPVRVAGGFEEGDEKLQEQRKNGAIRRPPRWLVREGSQNYWFAEAVSVSVEGSSNRLTWLPRATSRHASSRPLLLD